MVALRSADVRRKGNPMIDKTKWMLTVALVFGCGLLARPIVEPRAAHAQVTPNGAVGRYQLTTLQNTLYFVDTATGRVWRAGAFNPNLEWSRMETPPSPSR